MAKSFVDILLSNLAERMVKAELRMSTIEIDSAKARCDLRDHICRLEEHLAKLEAQQRIDKNDDPEVKKQKDEAFERYLKTTYSYD